MLDKLTSRNHVDFRARYEGTFGWMLNEGKKTFVRIGAVDSSAMAFYDSADREYFAYANRDLEFEFIPVNKGWFMGGDSVPYYLHRIPARQWHRGICRQNTAMVKMTSGGLFAIEVSMKTIENIFEKGKPYCMTDDLCALSKHFALTASTVYFYNRAIGTRTGPVLSLSNNLMEQEINDMIRRNKYNLQVTTDA